MEAEPKSLASIYAHIPCEIVGDGAQMISGLCYDSRQAKPGDLFFCIAGFEADGNKYAKDAVSKGAAAIATTVLHPDLSVPQVIVGNDRRDMALAAAAFYDYPARKMRMIGITGTNGKTTTTYMYKRIAEKAGHKVGLIGTICNMIGDRELHAERTTPESVDLQALLAKMRGEGCDTVVMEVSSHSLALDRTYGIEFDVGVFTNLTQDHLDFHGTFDAYLAAKALLFVQSRVSVLNRDDPHTATLTASVTGDVVYYSAQAAAEYMAKDIRLLPQLTEYKLSVPFHDPVDMRVPIPGMFTVYNSLAAAASAIESGMEPEVVRDALADMPHVNGRFELLDTRGHGFTIILDYAHTPDSLENTLRTIDEFAQGRVITVFGCGGNRDAAKRPIMGEIATRLSTHAIVTSDNPRFEEPVAIMQDIEAGIPEGTDYTSIPDRRLAITHAISMARPGDIILLAGKGHETYQEICGVKHDFDEKVIVQEILDELGL